MHGSMNIKFVFSVTNTDLWCSWALRFSRLWTFYPEHEGSKFLWNFGIPLTENTAKAIIYSWCCYTNFVWCHVSRLTECCPRISFSSFSCRKFFLTQWYATKTCSHKCENYFRRCNIFLSSLLPPSPGVFLRFKAVGAWCWEKYELRSTVKK